MLGIRRSSSCIVRPRGIPLFFYNYRTPHLVPYYSYSFRLVTSCCGFLRYYAYCFYKSNLFLWVFLLKNFLNGLCLFRRFRKYLPMLMLINLQNGGLNQITFLFLFFPHLFEWLLLVSPTLTNAGIPLRLLLLLSLEPGFTGFTYSCLPWNLLFLKASSYVFLLFSKNFTWG